MNSESDEKRFVAKAVEASVRIAAIGVLVLLCYHIVAPFLGPIVWAMIIAVAAYPTYLKIERLVKGRKGLAATIMTLLMLLIMIVPALLLASTFISGINDLAAQLKEGTLVIPPPPPSVESWPVIGKQLSALWAGAAQNFEKTLLQYGDQIKAAGIWLLSAAGQMGVAVLLFIISVVIAGVMLAYAEGGKRFLHSLAHRLAGKRGDDLVLVAGSTVRSVFRGILGVSFIQATLAGLGLLVAGIPGAGLWAFVCLILCIVQIGTPLVMFPAAIYMWFTADTFSAILFTIWTIFVGVSDNILKPFLLGRGAESPMLIVLLGSIGGFLAIGVVGLFVGAVILTLGHRLFMVWLADAEA
jgi:predicted PurR-regulated permease PerM